MPKHRQSYFFGTLTLVTCRADTRRTSAVTGTGRDKLPGTRQKQLAGAIKRFAESNPSGISVIQVQVRLEEFLLGAGPTRKLLPFHAGAPMPCSLVKHLIFFNPTTCERTSTSPCARAAGPGTLCSSAISSTRTCV